jgi:uncharacterized membrane protein
LTEPGDYAISVTATSGTDTTMTAEATTTTTIEILVIAGVSLEIVGDSALSTTDAVEGVSYTLKVTNTGNMMDTVSLEASAEQIRYRLQPQQKLALAAVCLAVSAKVQLSLRRARLLK